MSLRTTLYTSAAMVAFGFAASSASAYDLGQYGKITGDMRYRYEHVDQESLPKEADANTVRLRLGYLTPTYQGLSGFVEGEGIAHLGPQRFDDGMNGNSSYPRVNDPDDLNVNQMYVNYALPGTGHSAKLGRQSISLDNQRFIGVSNFRQNDNSHDAVRFTLAPVKDMTADYIHSTEFHRSAGSRQPLGTYHGRFDLFHADYKLPAALKVAGYAYSLDFETGLKNSSTRTFGSRVEWRPKDALVAGITPLATVEFAQQQDAFESTKNYTEWYNWFEVGGAYQGYSLSAVYERLGGDGTASFQTPFASLHTFNGWVDKFGTTPNAGLEDYFLTFKAPIPLPSKEQKLAFETQLHQYSSDQGSEAYGQEVDVGLTYTPVEGHSISAQAGRYYADKFSDDTTKVWLYYDMKF